MRRVWRESGFVLWLPSSCPPKGPLAAYLNIHNLFCFSLAEEEIKTEQEVVEGMDISTRSKGE